MKRITEFEQFKIFSSHMVMGGEGTSGSGRCNTQCDGESGPSDCSSYTYEDDCNGGNRMITSESTISGPC